jgi:lon-related putative ATP-dependent protease
MPKKRKAVRTIGAGFALPPDALRWKCDASIFPFETTADAKPLDGVIGQKRAMEALQLGLGMRSPGYNIYASGTGGTGKLSTVRKLLKKMPIKGDKPSDIVYVNNFKISKEPVAAKLKAGDGNSIKKDMRRFVEEMLESIPNLFENKEFKNKRNTLVESFKKKQKGLFQSLEKQMAAQGFAMVQIQMGAMVRPAILPVIENQPVPFEQLEQLAANENFPAAKLVELKKNHQALHNKLEAAMKNSRVLERTMKEALVKLEQALAAHVVISLVDELREKYPYEGLKNYFDEMAIFTLDNIGRFKENDDAGQNPALAMMRQTEAPEGNSFVEWDVNVLVDNSAADGPVVIMENVPSYKNMFGTIEKTITQSGTWTTDFTKVQAGSVLRADGGYLIFHMLDAMTEPGVWKALKRTIKSRQVEIESFDSFLFYMTSALKPQGIPVDVKFIVIGEAWLYYFLLANDEDFRKLFKIRADFDTVMKKNNDSVVKAARFITQVICNENLPHFDKSALVALIEEGVTLAGDQKKITTRFSVLADIARETGYWARQGRSKVAKAKHVLKALEARKYRRNMFEDKIQEMIMEDKFLISSKGDKVGEINGLAVYQVGDYAFGKPSRITVKVGMGRTGIINIEREAKLSGKTYDKGMLILGGFMRHRFSQNKPLSLSASIAFEQSYGGVDGDSASSTEAYGLLSALSEIPLSQSIAVTGSMNQNGEIQPIGGVNQKIEGFFSVCKARRLTGKQGVIIPIQNADELMLSYEVIEAVRKKKFHVWAVSTVDQGMEILTGKSAGEKDAEGKWTRGSINDLADKRLLKLAKDMQEFGKKKKDPGKSEKKPARKKAKDKKKS